MNTIKINGVTIETNGRSVSIKNGHVSIDGNEITKGVADKFVIEINGRLENLSADKCESITISGTAGTIKTMSGDVTCGAVAGAVATMSGDIKCGAIGGAVSTMSGDVSAS